MRLLYSEAAAADLVRLRAFIAEHAPSAAVRIAAELLTRIEQLRRFSDMGRMVPEAPAALAVRDFVFGRYVVRYMMLDASLVVLRLWHHLEAGRSAS